MQARMGPGGTCKRKYSIDIDMVTRGGHRLVVSRM
jgi:hypothetical protein